MPENFLKNEMRFIDDIPFHERTNEHYLRRNMLLYGWMLQIATRSHVPWNIFMQLLGPRYDELIGFIIQTDFRRFVSSSTSTSFTYKDEVMQAVEKVFNMPSFNYNISCPIAHLGGMTGMELIDHMNAGIFEITPRLHLPLIDLVADAIELALGGHVGTHVINEYLINARLITGPGDKWNFILAVYPNPGACPSDVFKQITMEVLEAKNELLQQGYKGRLPVLLLAPALENKENATSYKERYKDIYHLWSISAVRFFNLLDKTVKGKEEKAAEHFMTIFLNQPSIALHATEAFEELKKTLN